MVFEKLDELQRAEETYLKAKYEYVDYLKGLLSNRETLYWDNIDSLSAEAQHIIENRIFKSVKSIINDISDMDSMLDKSKYAQNVREKTTSIMNYFELVDKLMLKEEA